MSTAPPAPLVSSLTPSSIAALIRGTVDTDTAAVQLCSEVLLILQRKATKEKGVSTDEAELAAAVDVAPPPLPPRNRVDTITSASTTWNDVVLNRPAFMAYSFLRTPPACCPRVNEGTEGAIAAYPETSEVIPTNEPPSGVEVLVTVRDRYGEYRGCIAKDGQCLSNTGKTTGFINWSDNMAGSAEEDYLGCCKDQISGDEVVVEDALDECCGFAHLGHALLKDSNKNMVAEVKRDGAVHSSSGSTLGFFEPFRFGDMRAIALYVMLIDPGMLSREEA